MSRANAPGMTEGNNSPGRYGGSSGERGERGSQRVGKTVQHPCPGGRERARERERERIIILVHLPWVTCTSIPPSPSPPEAGGLEAGMGDWCWQQPWAIRRTRRTPLQAVRRPPASAQQQHHHHSSHGRARPSRAEQQVQACASTEPSDPVQPCRKWKGGRTRCKSSRLPQSWDPTIFSCPPAPRLAGTVGYFGRPRKSPPWPALHRGFTTGHSSYSGAHGTLLESMQQ